MNGEVRNIPEGKDYLAAYVGSTIVCGVNNRVTEYMKSPKTNILQVMYISLMRTAVLSNWKQEWTAIELTGAG